MTEHPILFSGPMVKAILEGRKTMTRRVIKPQPVLEKSDYPKDYKEWVLRRGKWSASGPSVYWLKHCPYGIPGDRLWVKETHKKWFPTGHDGNQGMFWHVKYQTEMRDVITDIGWEEGFLYQTPEDCGVHIEPENWCPSIFMPRWASRITLEVVSVRVERVQDISEEDAKAEGVEPLFTEAEITERPELAPTRGSYKNYLWHGNFGQHGLGGSQSDAWSHQYSSYKDACGSFSSLWHSINAVRGFGWDTNPLVWVVEFKRIEV